MTDEPRGNQKDVWDKAKIIGGFLIPIAVLVAGYWVNTTIKDREIRANAVAIQSIKLANESAKERESALRRFEIAVSILRTPPGDDSTSSVREWAANEFQEYTGLPAAIAEEIGAHFPPGHWHPGHFAPEHFPSQP